MSIRELRNVIDEIDEGIVHLLNWRLEIAVEIGKLKRDEGLPLRIPHREREVLKRVWGRNGGPLSDEAVSRLFRLIIRETRRVEELGMKPEKQRLRPLRAENRSENNEQPLKHHRRARAKNARSKSNRNQARR
jgi:chorismate mutase